METVASEASQTTSEPVGSDQAYFTACRADFPCLDQQVNGRKLIYLDNAASSQTPQVVIDALTGFYRRDYSNIHRGVHQLSQRATDAYERGREAARRLLNAPHSRQVILTRGTTESINLVASSYGRSRLVPGDEVLISHMEHHSGIVPWQMVCEQTGAKLKVVPIDDDGDLDYEQFEEMLGERTRIVSMVHTSNALGTIVDVKRIVQRAHEAGAVVLIDGAQAAPHLRIDVQQLDCDFYAFSGHKVFGPTGIGVLYGKERLLELMPPYQGGGDMILSVTFEKTTYNELPFKFEAGTPNIAGAIGLGAAIEYFEKVGIERAAAWEAELLRYATDQLSGFCGLRIIGTAAHKAAVISFVMLGAHPHDIGTILDHQGIAIRAGHHCAQPVMKRFGVPATARASLAFYNTREDVDALVAGIREVGRLMGLDLDQKGS